MLLLGQAIKWAYKKIEMYHVQISKFEQVLTQILNFKPKPILMFEFFNFQNYLPYIFHWYAQQVIII